MQFFLFFLFLTTEDLVGMDLPKGFLSLQKAWKKILQLRRCYEA